MSLINSLASRLCFILSSALLHYLCEVHRGIKVIMRGHVFRINYITPHLALRKLLSVFPSLLLDREMLNVE
jgi:hypothetical protein